MARTFADDLASDAANVYLTDFSESIQIWPLGVQANAITVSAVIDRQGAPEGFGDKAKGERLVYRAEVRIAESQSINYRKRHHARDVLYFDSQLWAIERPGRSDQSILSIHVWRGEGITTKATRIGS